jgi:hypothetical protein
MYATLLGTINSNSAVTVAKFVSAAKTGGAWRDMLPEIKALVEVAAEADTPAAATISDDVIYSAAAMFDGDVELVGEVCQALGLSSELTSDELTRLIRLAVLSYTMKHGLPVGRAELDFDAAIDDIEAAAVGQIPRAAARLVLNYVLQGHTWDNERVLRLVAVIDGLNETEQERLSWFINNM